MVSSIANTFLEGLAESDSPVPRTNSHFVEEAGRHAADRPDARLPIAQGNALPDVAPPEKPSRAGAVAVTAVL